MTYIPVEVFIECVQTSGIKDRQEYYELHNRGIISTDLMPKNPASEYKNTYMKAYQKRPEVIVHQKAYEQTPKWKAYRQTPEYKARMKAYKQSPKYKAYERERYQRPEVKARVKAYEQTPERKAYQKSYRKAYYLRNKKH